MISYSNPIWYGNYRIYHSTDAYFWLGAQARFSFIHDDYDLDDNRFGYGSSLAECIELIKEIEDWEVGYNAAVELSQY